MLIRLLFILLPSVYAAALHAEKPVVSIIIDDMGSRLAQDRKIFLLPRALGFSVLPHTRGVQQVIKAAKSKGNELILHLPMEPVSKQPPEPGMLTQVMDWDTFVLAIQKNIAAVPGIIAINNHEGSLLTADHLRMEWLAGELTRHRHIAFIDSRTTRHSVALKVTREFGVTSTQRDVFLDHMPGKVAQQFDKLISKAKQQGSALAIAHPYEETIEFLKENLGQLEQQGVELVPVSELMRIRQQALGLTRGSKGDKSISYIGRRL